jgi:3-oxoacyl-[acyl-carrier-protein] synthase II
MTLCQINALLISAAKVSITMKPYLEQSATGVVDDMPLIEEQIDTLLEEVLERSGDELVPLPLRVRDDGRDERERVVVTGMGVVTSIGIGKGAFWDSLAAGHSGISLLPKAMSEPYACKVAAQVHAFVPSDYMDAKEARRMSRSSHFAVAAAREALADAGLKLDDDNRDEVGVVVGCGTNSMPDTEQAARVLVERGGNRISPLFIPTSLPHMPACQVAIQLGITGYTTGISTACAAGSQALGEAAEVIRRGDALVMLAGGTEAPITELALASFCGMRALTTHSDDPARASRPFDVTRDGFVPAEGAAILVLERLDHARLRGATIYAEILGYGATSDAFHVTAPHPEGTGAAKAMQRALQRASVGPQQVDYINAHATSTPAGDVSETLAIKRAFGEYAYAVPISASKSMLGHLTAAAGAVEAVATIMAMQHSLIPPTINYEHPDPDCDLDYVPNEARPASIEIAVSNSFSFGGVNAVLVFGK